MSTYITLEEAKDHLRVDFYEDDDYIQSLCDMVEGATEIEIGEFMSGITWNLLTGSTLTGSTETTGVQGTETFPLRLKQAMLLMIGHYYSNREATIIGVNSTKVPFGWDWMVSPYKNWTIK